MVIYSINYESMIGIFGKFKLPVKISNNLKLGNNGPLSGTYSINNIINIPK